MKPMSVLAALLVAALFSIPSPVTAQDRQAAFDEWVRDPLHTVDGRIRITGMAHRNSYYRGYRCKDFDTAAFVVATVEKSGLHEKTAKGQRGILLRVLARQGCMPAARGEYVPVELGPVVSLDLGFEANEDWTALRVKAPDGAEIGLVYDASVFAMD